MISNLFNTKVDVIRIDSTKDSMGGYTEVKTVLHKNMRCRINWTTGIEKIQFDKVTYYRDAKVYCGVYTDIRQYDLIRYKSKDYEIVNISNVDEANEYMILEIKLID